MPEEIEIRLTKEGLEVGAADVEKIQSLTFLVNPASLGTKQYEIVWTKITTIAAIKQLWQLAFGSVISLPADKDVSKVPFLKLKA